MYSQYRFGAERWGKKYLFPSHQEYLVFPKSLFVSLEENSKKKMSCNSTKMLNFRLYKKKYNFAPSITKR